MVCNVMKNGSLGLALAVVLGAVLPPAADNAQEEGNRTPGSSHAPNDAVAREIVRRDWPWRSTCHEKQTHRSDTNLRPGLSASSHFFCPEVSRLGT
jgi:hypothetical protein